jgi:hypothetical protein
MDKIDFSHTVDKIKEKFPDKDIEDDFNYYIETALPDLFAYAKVGKFQMSPTITPYLDYVIEREYDADGGEWGKTRALYDSEKSKYLPVFQNVVPDIDMDLVRLVEYCWYNCSEADDYYDETEDPFYKEV